MSRRSSPLLNRFAVDKVQNKYSKKVQAFVPSQSNKQKSRQKHQDEIVFRPIQRNQLPPSPVELAIKEGKKIAFYIPSEEYQESALFVLHWAMERLHKRDSSLVTPEYEFVIGKQASDCDGKLDENGRVIISHAGAARLG